MQSKSHIWAMKMSNTKKTFRELRHFGCFSLIDEFKCLCSTSPNDHDFIMLLKTKTTLRRTKQRDQFQIQSYHNRHKARNCHDSPILGETVLVVIFRQKSSPEESYVPLFTESRSLFSAAESRDPCDFGLIFTVSIPRSIRIRGDRYFAKRSHFPHGPFLNKPTKPFTLLVEFRGYFVFSIFYGKASVSPRSFPLYCMYTCSFFPSDQQPWSNRIAHSFFPLRLFGWWNGSERTFATVLSRDWQNNVAFLSSPFHFLALYCMCVFFFLSDPIIAWLTLQ